MDYTNKETIINNMKDFGCEENAILEFMKKYDEHNVEGQKMFLSNYRRKLLDSLHRAQKNIDLLDYLVYQLNKCNFNKK